MKNLKQIIRRWKIECKNWGKLSQKHAKSKESEIKGYVTKNEHLTGEALSFVEGWIHALEWMINNNDLLDKILWSKEKK